VRFEESVVEDTLQARKTDMSTVFNKLRFGATLEAVTQIIEKHKLTVIKLRGKKYDTTGRIRCNITINGSFRNIACKVELVFVNEILKEIIYKIDEHPKDKLVELRNRFLSELSDEFKRQPIQVYTEDRCLYEWELDNDIIVSLSLANNYLSVVYYGGKYLRTRMKL
jgi:F0F1-type ATP synthase gamma subunit